MKIRNLMDEDIVNYKKTAMFIATCFCDFKCCKELNLDICICQNSPIAKTDIVDMPNEKIIKRYLKNKLTKAIVFGGLEPFKQYDELIEFIKDFRAKSDDDIVIYTGYNKNEINLDEIKKFKNIIIKFGRYIPGHKVHFDEVLGVNLASDNQYAEII